MSDTISKHFPLSNALLVSELEKLIDAHSSPQVVSVNGMTIISLAIQLRALILTPEYISKTKRDEDNKRAEQLKLMRSYAQQTKMGQEQYKMERAWREAEYRERYLREKEIARRYSHKAHL